jgi:hypothetical protein
MKNFIPMNAKILLLLSLAVNILLGALWLRRPAASDTAPASASTVVAPAGTTPNIVIKKVAGPAAEPAKPSRAFDWRLVESPDYKEYIANLRAIGCPEETIRDIITADVNKLFTDRKKSQRSTSTNRFEFWKTGMQMFAQAFDEEKMKKQQELTDEKRALLKDLLGVEPDLKSELAAGAAGMNIMEQMLDFLPESKHNAVLELLQQYQAKAIKNLGNAATGDPEDMKKLTGVQREMEAALAKILSPQELEDYNLRMSNTANMMRFQLAAFEPNEQEFRDIFRMKKAFDDEFGPFGVPPADKAEKARYDDAKKQMEEQINGLLGPDRAAEYKRSQDFAYQGMVRVAQREGLGKQAAVQVYDMKKTAEGEAKRVREDRSLSSDQRQAALRGIREETERSIRQVYGDKGFESYQKQQGAFWLKGISPDPKP